MPYKRWALKVLDNMTRLVNGPQDPGPPRGASSSDQNGCEASTTEQGRPWKPWALSGVNYVCSAVPSVDLGFALEEKRAQNCFYGDRSPLGCSWVLSASIWGDGEAVKGNG